MATKPNVKQPTDTWEIEWVKERLSRPGDYKAFTEQMECSRKIQRRMWDEKEVLTEKHPRKWVVMGIDGILALGDSLETVIGEIDSRGISRDEIVIEHLVPFPSVMPRPIFR